jgi:hypothetical protein
MGIEIVTTVLLAATASPPAGAYDLTTLANVHDEFTTPITATNSDAFLSRAITQESAKIAQFCDRVFQVETVQDFCQPEQDSYPWQTPGGVFALQLRRWPLVSPGTPINFTGNTNSNNSITNVSSTTGLSVGMPIGAADGSLPIGCYIAAISGNTITLGGGVAASSEAGLSLNAGVQVVQYPAVGQPNYLTYGTDYTADAARGWLLRIGNTGAFVKWEAEPTYVVYQGGYTTIPSDLEEACLRLVVARYTARGRDPMLVQQDQPGSLGSRRWWVGKTPGQSGAFPPDIEAILARYRVPSAL